MSTITVVKKAGVIAIATDSLTTWGSSKESSDYIVDQHKILEVGESLIAISGPSSAKLAIKDYFARSAGGDLTTVDAIFRTWIVLHAALKGRYFLNPDESKGDSFESSRFDALIANPYGIFGVEAHRTVQEFSKFYAYGTGWQHALGAMHVAYHRTDLSAEGIARSGVEVAAEFDVDTGIPVISRTMSESLDRTSCVPDIAQ
jgi:ATP-dependent protease HslVU (ClpYQ) peptidase subunit